jgi:flagellar biosynthetic protein FlhB
MTEARTERVSPRKLAAAGDRRPISRALCAAVALAALGLAVDGASARSALEPAFALAFATAGSANPELNGAAALGASARALATILAPWLGAVFLGVVVAGAFQVFSVALPAARGERPSPFDLAARVRQLLAPERLLDAAIACAMLVVLAAVAWLTLAPSVRGVLALSSAEPRAAARSLLALFGALAFRLLIAGLVLGALDYLQRRIRHALSLRMTPGELRDEQREQYGDPLLRAERLRRMRASAAPKGRS